MRYYLKSSKKRKSKTKLEKKEPERIEFNSDWQLKGSKGEHCLKLLVGSKVLELKINAVLGLSYLPLRKEIKEDFNEAVIKRVNEIRAKIAEKVNLVESFKIECEQDRLLVEHFEPSKTAKNGLNFVLLKDLEIYKEVEAPSILVDLLKLIYLLAKERIVDDNVLVANLLEVVMPKRRCTNVKDLFLDHILKDLNFSNEEYRKMIEIYELNAKNFGSGLMKISRGVSYISFIMKELIEYLAGSFKEYKGVKVQELRMTGKLVETFKMEIYNLENSLIR